MNFAHAKVSSVSKSTLGLRRAKDREAISCIGNLVES